MSIKLWFLSVCLPVCLLVLVSGAGVQAAPKKATTQKTASQETPQPAGPAKNVETRITSDKLTYSADKQQAIFETKVHVQRPDFELWANRLVVYLKPSPKTGDSKKGSVPEGMAGGDVDRLEAIGNVRMASEPNRSGTCSKAIYTASDGVLRMEGDPRISDGENTVTGEVIRYFTRENRSEVQGGKKRVEAVFSTPSKTPTPTVGGQNNQQNQGGNR